jgi:hypothetical protein
LEKQAYLFRYAAEITAENKFGRGYEETLVFEVREERPERFFRSRVFE